MFKTPTKGCLVFLGSLLVSKEHAQILEKKLDELKKANEVVAKLDPHYEIYLLQNPIEKCSLNLDYIEKSLVNLFSAKTY